jgi:FtsP/CotA-like multicopper oxidase with cupredoxin domain
VHEGDRVIIHFHNALPEPTTIHWHGVHLPADADS